MSVRLGGYGQNYIWEKSAHKLSSEQTINKTYNRNNFFSKTFLKKYYGETVKSNIAKTKMK